MLRSATFGWSTRLRLARYFCAAVAERESRCHVFSPSISLLAHRVGWVRSSAHHIPRLYRPEMWIYNGSLLILVEWQSPATQAHQQAGTILAQIGRKSLGHTAPLVGAGFGTGGIRNIFRVLSTDPRPTTHVFNIWWKFGLLKSRFGAKMTHFGSKSWPASI